MMTTTLVVDAEAFPNFDGQEIGRELELELTAVVTTVLPRKGDVGPAAGGIPSEVVILTVLRADITQTT